MTAQRDPRDLVDWCCLKKGLIWSWAGDGGIIAFALVKFFRETGTIVSHVINHAAHLEKKFTHPGMVSISRTV